MVDYSKLRKKFPAKNPNRTKKVAAIKAIAREYEMKKAELNGLKAPVMKKGIVFYAVVILGLLMLGSLVLSATGRGGRAPISKAQLNARKSIDALAIALGRYRYHVGSYPTSEEGLAQLASTVVAKKGWNGPYIRQVVLDPWGRDYVYVANGEGENPTLYSRGADGIAGTTDDILPDPKLFDEPFRDTSWTKGWMPAHLRGYVLAPNEHTKKVLEKEVQEVLKKEAETQNRELAIIPRDVISRLVAMKLADTNSWRIASSSRVWNGEKNSVSFLTHWNYDGRDGEIVAIVCETSGDEGELFVNGESRGRIKAKDSRLEWNEKFDPGEIKVIAFKNNVAIGEAMMRTADKPHAVAIASDVEGLADGELATLRVFVQDEFEVKCPLATNKISFSLEGPGEILAIANGANGEGEEIFTRDNAGLFDGRLVVLIRRTLGSGVPLKITARADNLYPATIILPRKADK